MSMKGKHHSKITKGKISRAKKGKQLSEETKRKMSKTRKGRSNPFYGKHHMEESKRKISEAGRGRHHTKEARRKISEGNKGKLRSEEMRERYSKAQKDKHPSEETKRKMRRNHRGMLGRHHTKLTKKKMSISAVKTRRKRSLIQTRNWQNPEYKEKQLMAIFVGHKISPNKPERRLRNDLNRMFPEEYEYVGDGKTFIGGKSPDFININGQKKIIELFGTFWHSEERTGRTKKQEERQRIKHFAKYGFKTLIVWQEELENIKQLRRKLIKFQKG